MTMDSISFIEEYPVFVLTAVVSFVLFIIIFLKFLRLADDIHFIKNNIGVKAHRMKEVYKKNPNIESLLFDAVYWDLYTVMNKDATEYLRKELCNKVREKYKPVYQKVGISFPEVLENINNRADWLKTFPF